MTGDVVKFHCIWQWNAVGQVPQPGKQNEDAAQKEEMIMSSNKSGSKMTVPQAKEAMDRFKMEVASEIGVPLSQGYNGDLTSAQNGSVGGEMVRQMIKKQEEQMAGK